VQSVATAEADVQSLVTLPGVEGLRRFVSALAARETGTRWNAKFASVRAAIDRFETFLDEIGGSQRRLRERLDAGRVESHAELPELDLPADDLKVRANLFMAGATITGRSAAASVMMCVLRIDPNNPQQTQSARAHGIIGLSCRPHAVPLETGHTPMRIAQHPASGPETFSHEPLSGDAPDLLLTKFCSEPLPRITSQQSGARTVNVIDYPEHSGQSDLVTAYRNAGAERHPATLRPAIGELWFLQHVASRRLVFDAYLHRDLARQCIPSLGLHLWTPDVSQHASARWSTRFPGGPRLEFLEPGLRNIGTPAYSRLPELATEMFDKLEWNRDEFIGYRCEVEYPVWRAGYCMSFDFSSTAMGG
jgi:hypothetical protein